MLKQLCFDKTGTLTKGIFKVTEIRPENNISKDELIACAAYAENYSNHPIATSILRAYDKEIITDKIKEYEEISGHGVKVCSRWKRGICWKLQVNG